MHFVQPAQCRILGEVRPDRDRVRSIEGRILIGERWLHGARRELDAGEILGRPLHGPDVGVTAVPLDVRVRGCKHAEDTSRGAAEVKNPCAGFELASTLASASTTRSAW